jgi:hypothetical protein
VTNKEKKYLDRYPELTRLLQDYTLTYQEIGRRLGMTKQAVQFHNVRLGRYGRPPKSVLAAKRKLEEARERLRQLENKRSA